MRALLDVNVLLALLDSGHAQHDRASRWFARQRHDGWATCAFTENGFVRIISQASYPAPLTTDYAVDLLERACETANHEYWPCDVTLRDPRHIGRRQLLSHRQVTDVYLLALAAAHGGRFVTFDRAITQVAAPSARPENLVIL